MIRFLIAATLFLFAAAVLAQENTPEPRPTFRELLFFQDGDALYSLDTDVPDAAPVLVAQGAQPISAGVDALGIGYLLNDVAYMALLEPQMGVALDFSTEPPAWLRWSTDVYAIAARIGDRFVLADILDQEYSQPAEHSGFAYNVSATPNLVIISEGQDVRDAVYAPDKFQVAYIVREGAGEALYLASLLGDAPRLLAESDSPLLGLSWSSDSTQIIATREDGALLRVDTLSGEFGVIAGAACTAAYWSPGADEAAYVSADGALFVVPLNDPVSARTLASDARGCLEYPLVWSTDGTQLIYASTAGLTRVAADGSESVLLLDGPELLPITWALQTVQASE